MAGSFLCICRVGYVYIIYLLYGHHNSFLLVVTVTVLSRQNCPLRCVQIKQGEQASLSLPNLLPSPSCCLVAQDCNYNIPTHHTASPATAVRLPECFTSEIMWNCICVCQVVSGGRRDPTKPPPDSPARLVLTVPDRATARVRERGEEAFSELYLISWFPCNMTWMFIICVCVCYAVFLLKVFPRPVLYIDICWFSWNVNFTAIKGI